MAGMLPYLFEKSIKGYSTRRSNAAKNEVNLTIATPLAMGFLFWLSFLLN